MNLGRYIHLLGAFGILVIISGGVVWCFSQKSYSLFFRIFLCIAYLLLLASLLFKWSTEFNDGLGDVAEYTSIGIGCIMWFLLIVQRIRR